MNGNVLHQYINIYYKFVHCTQHNIQHPTSQTSSNFLHVSVKQSKVKGWRAKQTIFMQHRKVGQFWLISMHEPYTTQPSNQSASQEQLPQSTSPFGTASKQGGCAQSVLFISPALNVWLTSIVVMYRGDAHCDCTLRTSNFLDERTLTWQCMIIITCVHWNLQDKTGCITQAKLWFWYVHSIIGAYMGYWSGRVDFVDIRCRQWLQRDNEWSFLSYWKLRTLQSIFK